MACIKALLSENLSLYYGIELCLIMDLEGCVCLCKSLWLQSKLTGFLIEVLSSDLIL
ncbi:hypothetical protein HanOQP8_Chr02g0047141 [Helianthus annuus]|nr:hypothetical protein HanOQP8_Chr02g0047141 [Helianthus annuus]